MYKKFLICFVFVLVSLFAIKVVADVGAPPEVDFSISSTTVQYGGYVDLTWSAFPSNFCTASGDWSGTKPSSGSTRILDITGNKTFNIRCDNNGGYTDRSVSVVVEGGPSSPSVYVVYSNTGTYIKDEPDSNIVNHPYTAFTDTFTPDKNVTNVVFNFESSSCNITDNDIDIHIYLDGNLVGTDKYATYNCMWGGKSATSSVTTLVAGRTYSLKVVYGRAAFKGSPSSIGIQKFKVIGIYTPSPVNGDCSNNHFYCDVGLSKTKVTTPTAWKWNCVGYNGGTTASCTELQPASLTINDVSPITMKKGETKNVTVIADKVNVGMGVSFRVIPYLDIEAEVTTNYSAEIPELASGNVTISIPDSSTISAGPHEITIRAIGEKLAGGDIPAEKKMSIQVEELPHGELTITSCTLPTNIENPTCYPIFKWEVFNPISGATTKVDRIDGNTVFDYMSGPNERGPAVSRGSTTFYLKHNGVTLDSAAAVADCPFGSEWNSTTKKCEMELGSLSSDDCYIEHNKSVCYPTHTWSVTNPVSGATTAIKRPDGSIVTPSGTPASGTYGGTSNNAVAYGQSGLYHLFHNGIELDSDTATADCILNTEWNSTTKKCEGSVMGYVTGSLNITSCKIGRNGSTCTPTFNWSVTNPISGVGTSIRHTSGNPTISSLNSTGTLSSYTTPSAPSIPYGRHTFSLYHNNAVLDEAEVRATCDSNLYWDQFSNRCRSEYLANFLNTTPESCVISEGASTCQVEASWNIVDPTSPNLYDANTGTILSNLNQTALFPVWVAYPKTTFQTRNGTDVINAVDVYASCITGTGWNETTNKCEVGVSEEGGGIPSGSISATSCTIPTGQSQCTSYVSWDARDLIVGGATEVTKNNPHGSVFFDASYMAQVLKNSFTSLFKKVGNLISESFGKAKIANAQTTPVCASTHYNCSVGMNDGTDNNETSTQWTWICFVPNTGNMVQCSESKSSVPAPSCSSTHYSCSSGTSGSNSENSTTWSWTCTNSLGSSVSCSETRPVSTTPTGSLSSSNCIIPNGSSYCSPSHSWSVTNPISGATTAVRRPDGSVVATGTSGTYSGTNNNYAHYGPSNLYSLVHNGVELDSDTATASCGPGSTWNGTICVAPTPTGSLSSSNCIIPNGSSYCSPSHSWSVTNPISGATTAVRRPDGSVVATGTSGTYSGTNNNYAHYGPSNLYSLVHNGVELDSSSVSASCASGTTWNATEGKCIETTQMSGTISASPTSCVISAGQGTCNSTLTWNVSNAEIFEGTAITSSYPTANTILDEHQESGTVVAQIPYNSRTFYLYNNSKLLGEVSVSVVCASGTQWDSSLSKCMSIATENVSGSNQPVSIDYGTTTFYLYHHGSLLGQSSVTALCEGGGEFSGVCLAPVAPVPPEEDGGDGDDGGSSGDGDDGGGTTALPSPSSIITAEPSSIYIGNSSTLTWSSLNTNYCTGINFDTGNATSGSVSVSPEFTTSYTVLCVGDNGQSYDTVTVTVTTADKIPIYKEQ
ncbi:MAG: hypothetical protein WC898_03825 [Candidatus Paceibacterota bacterium]|jgi:hypothetical protein